jgi:hypothetical protein
MTIDDPDSRAAPQDGLSPRSFLAAATALTRIEQALQAAAQAPPAPRRARTPAVSPAAEASAPAGEPPAADPAAATSRAGHTPAVETADGPTDGQAAEGQAGPTGPEQALAALLLLRQVRDQLAGWEPELIEAARAAGASWADLAQPLGVASRQAAERRYLRVRPGSPGSTGEERVRATRDRRAADRTVVAWARAHAADLRQLAGQITALTDLPDGAAAPLTHLATALAHDDPARLVDPLTSTHTYLEAAHPDLATRVAGIVRRTDRLRTDSGDRRRARS